MISRWFEKNIQFMLEYYKIYAALSILNKWAYLLAWLVSLLNLNEASIFL